MTQQSFIAPLTTETDLNLVSREELFEHAQGLFDSIARRAHELYEDRGCASGHEWDDWFQAESELLRPVELRIMEFEEHLIARVKVTGFHPHEIKVCLEPRCLKISGKAETGADQWTGGAVMGSLGHSLRSAERIFHSVDLPTEVDAANAKATFKDSSLELVMPRARPARSARAEAKVA
jgi:HSP20 family molecular chaperone IbpA